MAHWRNSAQRWGSVARLLHWTIALLILGLFIVGEVMGDMAGGPDKFFVYAMHKSLGLLVLALIICRLVWRLADPAPPDIPGIPVWQRRAATFTHWALYALMLAVPLSGWLVHSLAGYATHWFGQADLPLLPTLTAGVTDRELVEETGEIHGTIAWALVAVAVLHLAAALYHHFLRRDATLARMTPFVRDPSA